MERIFELSDAELSKMYNESFEYACFHGIHKVVYHTNYKDSVSDDAIWIESSAAFWKNFLSDKPQNVKIYIENCIYDRPDLLAQLCDTVNDPRFMICLDTGHLNCNSDIEPAVWIKTLGKRIGHAHLHNNDGTADRHNPLGKGTLDMAAIIEQLVTYTNCEMYVLECDYDESLRWLEEKRIIF
jgi:sugar phosphate isomerase/epimerase